MELAKQASLSAGAIRKIEEAFSSRSV
jgi:hypothetical protein